MGDVILVITLLLICLGLGAVIGKYMARSLNDEKICLTDRFICRMGIDTKSQMNWKEYLLSTLVFTAFGFIFLQAVIMCQAWLPLNPNHRPNLPFLMAFNITTSFVTNTNWQNYAGESTMGLFSQMVGLTVQNFLSAAVGVAVLLAFVRGLLIKESITLGNFWKDVSRFTIKILLPLSILFAIFFIQQGMPQTFKGTITATTLEGKAVKIPVGPVASQMAIKMIGGNGGGFYNGNATHPFENPTPISNFIQLILILLLPVSCVFMLIFMLPNRKEGYMILSVMGVMLLVGIGISYWGQSQINSITQMKFLEGTESRFSTFECSLWSVLTTAVANGSVNCMHSSLSPLSQLVALFNMMTGEVIFGGVGSGLYGMFLYVLLTVFLAGLMVGRTPEYFGKKIETKEVYWVGIALLFPGLLNLVFSAIALNTSSGLSSISHSGEHGLSEVLYAFSSSFGNNGSAFAGLSANTDFYNTFTGMGMLFGRFIVIVACLVIAGRLGVKKAIVAGPGTLKTDTTVFAFLLLGVIIVMGALTFFPALVLGPIAEHLIMG